MSVVTTYDTFLLVVAHGEVVVDLVRSTTDAHLMILHWRIVVEYQVLPISTKSIDSITIGVGQFVWISIDRSLTTIHCTLILKDGVVSGACHITLLPCALPAV